MLEFLGTTRIWVVWLRKEDFHSLSAPPTLWEGGVETDRYGLRQWVLLREGEEVGQQPLRVLQPRQGVAGRVRVLGRRGGGNLICRWRFY